MFRRNWDVIIGFMGLGLMFGSNPVSNLLPFASFNAILGLGLLLMIISAVGVLFRIKKRPSRLGLKRDLGSLIGITICKKCGTKTKLKYTESIPDRMGNEWIGYAICPKCGNKEKWLSGDEGAGGGA